MKIYGLLELFAKELGKKGAEIVKNDLSQNFFEYSHDERIKDLASDSGVDYEYLSDLINHSKSDDEFKAIDKYLMDNDKTVNLLSSQRATLKKLMKSRIIDLLMEKQFQQQNQLKRKQLQKQLKLGGVKLG